MGLTPSSFAVSAQIRPAFLLVSTAFISVWLTSSRSSVRVRERPLQARSARRTGGLWGQKAHTGDDGWESGGPGAGGGWCGREVGVWGVIA